MDKDRLVRNCRVLLNAYTSGLLGECKMPEDSHPDFSNEESRLFYFTLPMSLNYQRDSYKLWESALETFNDEDTKKVFSVQQSAEMSADSLRKHLLEHKVALQPNKHIQTWQTIAKTIFNNWGSITNLLKAADNDYAKLRQIVQIDFKKGFPYLSGPKIFNYWCFILSTYGKIDLQNSNLIEIAPDTHITQCSVKLGVITSAEAESLSKQEISQRWRTLLDGSGITPIEMHPPLWFWSRNNFVFNIDNKN